MVCNIQSFSFLPGIVGRNKHVAPIFLLLCLTLLYWVNDRFQTGEVETRNNIYKAITSRTSSDGTPLITEEPFSSPFRPVKALKRYIEEHSQDVLLSEYHAKIDNRQRKYAVAYYWCPHRAGNILHAFFSTITWSIIHNRTLLWIYHNHSNQEEDCQVVLRRAPWLPSYYEWKRNFGLADPVPVSLMKLNNDNQDDDDDDERHQVVLYPQIPDVLPNDKTIFRNGWSDHPLKTQEYVDYIGQLPSSMKSATKELYSEGQEFLYGMLYANLFELQKKPPMDIAVGNSTITTTAEIEGTTQNHDGDEYNTVFSVALHSRHTIAADDGSFVPSELQCLKRMLREAQFDNRRQYKACRVHLMSDRPKTIKLLTDFLTTETNCSVITANHDHGKGPVLEHGPWAGAGYLEDLDMASHARHAIIGDKQRSSTKLLFDHMTYQTRILLSKQSMTRAEKAKIALCKLPAKPQTGYDYGPGSPTFRHRAYLDPLPPLGVVSDYIKSNKTQNNGIVLIKNISKRPSIQEIYNILNSFLYAIIHGMDMRWIATGDGDISDTICEEGGSLVPKEWARKIQVAIGDDARPNTTVFSLDTMIDLSENLKISVESSKLRYDASSWNNVIDDPSFSALKNLFAEGQDLAYGTLFHEIFSYCPLQASTTQLVGATPELALPSFTIVLLLEHLDEQDGSDAVLENARGCIKSLIVAAETEEETSLFEKINRHVEAPSCHIFVLSDTSTIQETVLAPLLKNSSGLMTFGKRDDDSPILCTFSFYDMIAENRDEAVAAKAAASFSISSYSWKQIQDSSQARTGWVETRHKEIGTQAGILNTKASFVRDRLEYKRYWETWKKGRDPFEIDPLPTCYY